MNTSPSSWFPPRLTDEDRQMAREDDAHVMLGVILAILLSPVWLVYRGIDLVRRFLALLCSPLRYRREHGIVRLATYCEHCHASPLQCYSYVERFHLHVRHGYGRCIRCGHLFFWEV